MDIRTLQYVVTLAEELHFGRAARRHFISAQPFGQLGAHVLALHFHRAGVGRYQPVQHLQQRGFAAAAGPEQHQRLAGV